MIKLSKLRSITVLLGITLILILTFAEKPIGTYCNLCPVGFAQIAAASRNIPTGMIAGVAAGLLFAVIFGRAFCAWLCPSVLIKPQKTQHKAYKHTPGYLRRMPYILLGLALVISFIVQFPVFCLICPIGLFFGFLFAVFKLLHVYEPGWNLIIFPAMLALELLIFRRWCAYICPIAGIFRLVRKIPLPKVALIVDKTACLHSHGKNCRICANNCSEGLEIAEMDNSYAECCTNCMQCKDNCPSKAIKPRLSQFP